MPRCSTKSVAPFIVPDLNQVTETQREREKLEVAPVLMKFTVSGLNHRRILAPEHEDEVNVTDLNGCGTSFILFP